MPNKTTELRDAIELKMLWLIHTLTPNEEKSVINCIESLIEETILAVIGEDDYITKLSGNSRFDQQVSNEIGGQNTLRASQRDHLHKIVKGD